MSVIDTERPTSEAQFEVMGSTAHIIVVGADPDLVTEAWWRLEELERMWSRFLPDSEVSTLTRLAGTPVAVSPETAILVRRAMDAWRLTGGAFDANVLGDVVRAGYDRSFAELADRADGAEIGDQVADLPAGSVASTSSIEIDGCTVRLPPGTGFDPGGIGKGLAADIVVDELIGAGAAGVCVNLGGDLRVAGSPPDGVAWTIELEHPWTPYPVMRLGIVDGAIATSTTLGRRWTVGGESRHHLIDPRSGEVSDTDLTLATVIARRGWVAEVLTKAVLLRGSEQPFDLIDGTGSEALAVDDLGEIRTTDGFADFVAGGRMPPTIWTGDEAIDHPEHAEPSQRRDATDGN